MTTTKRRPRGSGRIYLRGKTWWCRYSVRGLRYEESCKTPHRGVAEEYLRIRVERGTPWRDRDVDRLAAAQIVELPDRDIACQGRIGAISEMLVAVDLMNKGYEVFRPMSAHACCDIVAIKDNIVVRFEVKTGAMRSDGSITKSTIRNRGSFDVLATLVRGKLIVYNPPLNCRSGEISGLGGNSDPVEVVQ
jgi:hypothetical protein